MTRFFWRNFFQLLLLFVAAAEWTCFAWLSAAASGVTVGPAVHLLMPFAIYAVNRAIVRRPVPSPGPWRTLRRAYTGAAFASLFGCMLLILVGVLWALIRGGFAAAELAGADMPVEELARTARALATAAVLAAAVAIAYGYGPGQRRLWINRLEVRMERLDRRLDGLRLIQISDVHLGPFMDERSIAGYVDRLNALEPDVVVITGDITDGLEHASRTFPALGRIRAPCGVFAILGNHDFYAGADRVEEALLRWTTFCVLRDSRAVIERDGAHLNVIGLDDRGMDWARGVRHCTELDVLFTALPRDAPVLLLTHRPDLFGQAARLGIELVLAGHTHGGQMAIPWTRGRAATLAHFMTRYPRGTYRKGRSTLHVNLGLGITGQPVRVASPREITLVTLRSPERPRDGSGRILAFSSEPTTKVE